MKPANQSDYDLRARLPKDRWFAAGAVCVPSAKIKRLVRLGLAEQRNACCPGVSRRYDYYIDSKKVFGVMRQTNKP